MASLNGYFEIVCALLEHGAYKETKDKVRNQMMMVMMCIIKIITIVMLR